MQCNKGCEVCDKKTQNPTRIMADQVMVGSLRRCHSGLEEARDNDIGDTCERCDKIPQNGTAERL